jgi:hypothetical protein
MRERPPLGRMFLDAVALAVLVAGAGLAFGPAYGGTHFLIALSVGAAVGAVAALLPAVLRWPGWITVPLVVVGYLIFGGLAAVPRSTAAGVLPTGESVRLLAVGVIRSWKQMLTVAVPVGSGGTLLLPAYLSAVVLATAGTVLALRTTIPLLALLAPGVMAAGAALLGAQEPFHPAISGTALGLAALIWAGWRRHATGLPGLDARRPLALLALLIPAVAAGLLLGPHLVPAAEARTIARDVVIPPFDPSLLPSPLSGYRNYVKKQKDQPIFTISGLPANTRVQLCVLDSWDGKIYSTSEATGSFTRVGDRVAGVPAGNPLDLEVTVKNYQGPWVPGVGYLAGATFAGADAVRLSQDFRYNRQTGSGLITSNLLPGDHLRLAVSQPIVPTVAQLAKVPVQKIPVGPTSDKQPPEVAAKAQEWSSGATDPVGVVESIRTHLSNDGWFSHDNDKSPGGHGADRIRKLLTAKTMYGDAEQYAVAMALMVRAQGIPARVVMGFKPQRSGGTVDLTGGQMTAWVEVPFADYGWVAFDPLPSETKEPPKPKPAEGDTAAKQQQVQPPPPPIPPKDAQPKTADDVPQPDKQDPQDDKPPAPPPAANSSVPWGWVAVLVISPLVLLLPVLLILLLKRRRRKRLAAGPPDQRIAGAWTYLLGTAADYGRLPTGGTTRVEAAEQLTASFAPRQLVGAGAPGAGRGPTAAVVSNGRVAVLARQADARVFSPEPIDPTDADRYWSDVEKELATMTQAQSLWRRLRARLSLASLRRVPPPAR